MNLLIRIAIVFFCWLDMPLGSAAPMAVCEKISAQVSQTRNWITELLGEDFDPLDTREVPLDTFINKRAFKADHWLARVSDEGGVVYVSPGNQIVVHELEERDGQPGNLEIAVVAPLEDEWETFLLAYELDAGDYRRLSTNDKSGGFTATPSSCENSGCHNGRTHTESGEFF